MLKDEKGSISVQTLIIVIIVFLLIGAIIRIFLGKEGLIAQNSEKVNITYITEENVTNTTSNDIETIEDISN